MYPLKAISLLVIATLIVSACGGGNTNNQDRVRIVSEESYELENLTLAELADLNIVAQSITDSGIQSRSEFTYDSNGNLKTIERYSLADNDSPTLESVTTHTYELSGDTLISSNIKTEDYDNFDGVPYIDYQFTYQELWEQGLIVSEEISSSGFDIDGEALYESIFYRDYFYNDQAQLISIEGTSGGENEISVDFFYDASGRTDRYELTFFDWDNIYTTSFTHNEKGAVISSRREEYDPIDNEVSSGETTFYSFDKDLNVMIFFSLSDSDIEDGFVNSTYVYVQYFEETGKCDVREEASKKAFPFIAVPYCFDRNIY